MTDAELVLLFSSDKDTASKAFAEFYSRHSSRIYAYCRRFLNKKEDAQDAFQEGFSRFYKMCLEGREMTNAPALLLRITRNVCINLVKKTKKTLMFEDYMSFHSNNSSDKDELLDLIKMALELLDDEYKDVFILREYDGLSYNEIAEITGLSISNVKVRIFRAKEKIREVLSPYLADLQK